MKRTVCSVAIGVSLLAGQVSAQETKTYRYDALGRMIGVTRDGAGAASHSSYGFDAADNRTSLNVWAIPPRAAVNELRPGETLLLLQQLTSPDGRSKLVLQGDGNLVLYFGSAVLWHAGTFTGRSLRLEMQTDGNLVLYDPGVAPVWYAITSTPGARLVLQNDCNLVIYNGSTPLWYTGTQC